MALIVEDGTVVASANTFVDVAAVEAYFDEVGLDRTVWDALSTADKEAAIIRAARHHESVYGVYYSGQRSDEDQELSWPRRGATGYNAGWELDWNVVPKEILWAQSELTHRTADGTLLLVDSAPGTTNQIVKRRKLDVLETEDEFASADSSSQVRHAYVDQLLYPFILYGGGVMLTARS